MGENLVRFLKILRTCLGEVNLSVDVPWMGDLCTFANRPFMVIVLGVKKAIQLFFSWPVSMHVAF